MARSWKARAYQYKVSLVGPNGATLHEVGPATLSAIPNKIGILIFQMRANFPIAGKHTVKVDIDGRTEGEFSFNVHAATPQELAGLPQARLQ
jgi:hypothetical protein